MTGIVRQPPDWSGRRRFRSPHNQSVRKKVISESGTIGHATDLTLLAKARFGKAAEMRPRLLALVQDRLAEAGIELVS